MGCFPLYFEYLYVRCVQTFLILSTGGVAQAAGERSSTSFPLSVDKGRRKSALHRTQVLCARDGRPRTVTRGRESFIIHSKMSEGGWQLIQSGSTRVRPIQERGWRRLGAPTSFSQLRYKVSQTGRNGNSERYFNTVEHSSHNLKKRSGNERDTTERREEFDRQGFSQKLLYLFAFVRCVRE